MAACAPTTTTPTVAETTSTSTTTTKTTTTTTAPPEGATTTSTVPEAQGAVLVFGDWGSGTAAQEAVAEAMAAYAEENPVTAVLTTGDNLYSNDASLLLEPMQWVFRRDIEFWVSWGNHDVESSRRVEIVEEALGSPPRWTVHEWGRVDVVILDSNQVGSADQLGFLTETLTGSDDPTILVFHHPPLSCSSHGDTVSVLESWVPRFDDDVVLVLSGHDHNYQRFESSGISYVVTGG
ncbi:MAG: metallophosphoesterase family protein, partial [Acidimicrobiia bacterium]